MNANDQLLTAILNCRPIDLYLDQPHLSAEQKSQFEQMKKRVESGEPLQYVLGFAEFMGLTFKVDSRVLIPRPETETLIETILQEIKSNDQVSILDLGTGSGNIAVSLAKFLPESQLTAVDISPDALDVARENAKNHNCFNQINLICEDMISFLKKKSEFKVKFDIIVSNPPYIKTSELASLPLDVSYEPIAALDGGEDGLDFYRGIIAQAKDVLSLDGFLAFEIAETQALAIKENLNQNGFYVQIIQDLNNRDRIVIANLKNI